MCNLLLTRAIRQIRERLKASVLMSAAVHMYNLWLYFSLLLRYWTIIVTMQQSGSVFDMLL